jgi:hypothetical protein
MMFRGRVCSSTFPLKLGAIGIDRTDSLRFESDASVLMQRALSGGADSVLLRQIEAAGQ